MKKKNLRLLNLNKNSISKLNSALVKGGQPTTDQSGVLKVTKGEICLITKGICPTNYFDC